MMYNSLIIVIYIYIYWILLMRALRAHNNKPILERVY